MRTDSLGRLCLLTALTALTGCERAKSSADPSATALPESTVFPRPLVAGQASFADLTRDRVVLVDFWATWCEACTESIPRVRHLAQTYSHDQLVVVGVNVGEEAPTVLRYATEAHMGYPLFLDPDFTFADALGAREVPTMFVLDRHGRIVHRARDLDDALLERLEHALGAD